MLAPLLRQAEARHAQLLEAAPSELHPSLSAGFAVTASASAKKAAAIDALTADRRRATALEQSIQLAEALLRQDPEQYEILVADAGAMADGLGLDEPQHRILTGRMRERLATATLSAQLDPAARDPAQAEQDLARGRFRDAFDAAGIAAWRELVTTNQARRQAQEALATRDAGIVAEIRMLNRLAAAGRAEAPMPTPAEIETVFPGEGAQRLAAAARNRAGALYAEAIAAQPLDRDPAWIEAATDEADRAIRAEAVQRKRREFAQSGGGNLLAQYPALGAAVEEGLQDPSKLDLAIELYQRQLAKLGVPPRFQRPLPDEALTRLAGQFQKLVFDEDRADWVLRLMAGVGEDRAVSILHSLGDVPGGVRIRVERQSYAFEPIEGPLPIAPGHPEDDGVYDRLLDLHRQGDHAAFGELAERTGFVRERAELLFDILSVTPSTSDAAANELLDRIATVIPETDADARFQLTFAISELRKGHLNQDARELRKTYDRYYLVAAREDPDVGDPISDELQRDVLSLPFSIFAVAAARRAVSRHDQAHFPRTLNGRKLTSFKQPEVRAATLQFDAAVRERSEAAALSERFGIPFIAIKHNNLVGRRFEEVVRAILRAESYPVESARYEYAVTGIRYRPDGRIQEISGRITRIEAKSSASAPYSPGQLDGYSEHDAWVFRLDGRKRLSVMRFSEE